MKAIWLRQPWATLVAMGVKEWETRSAPPNGPMRPAGVRGMPGLAIEPGERIAIVASKARPGHLVGIGDFRSERAGDDWKMVARVGGYSMESVDPAVPLPLGVVVCTVAVAEALPIVGAGRPFDEHERRRPRVIRTWATASLDRLNGELNRSDISDQLPYGDWTPGRWAWRLTDVEPVTGRHEPVVIRGNRQGVCEIEETWT